VNGTLLIYPHNENFDPDCMKRLFAMPIGVKRHQARRTITEPDDAGNSSA